MNNNPTVEKNNSKNRRFAGKILGFFALLIALSIFGGLQLKENKRKSEIKKTIHELLAEAEQLMEENDTTAIYLDGRPLQRTGELIRRAAELLDEIDHEIPELKKNSNQIQEQVGARVRQLEFIALIEQAGIKAIENIDDPGFSKEQDIKQAFEKLNLNPFNDPPAQTARSVKQSKGLVREFILIGLQNWSKAINKTRPEDSTRLDDFIEQVDTNSWRTKLRAAVRSKDAAALDSLANSPGPASQPIYTAMTIGSAPGEGSFSESLKKILQQCQAENPSSYWPNLILGTHLTSTNDLEVEINLNTHLVQVAPYELNGEKPVNRQKQVPTQNIEAIAYLKAAVAVRPDIEFPWYALSKKLSEAGRTEKARDTMTKALQSHPDSQKINLLIASNFLSTGESRKAIPYFQKVIDRNFAIKFASCQLGLAYLDLAQYEEGRNSLMKAVNLSEQALNTKLKYMGIESEFDESFVSLSVASAMISNGDYLKSAESSRAFLQDHPNDLRGLLTLGYSLMAMGDATASNTPLQKARKLGLPTPEALGICGLSLMTQGKHQEAISLFKQALTLESNPNAKAQILNNIGACSRDRGHLAEAEEYFIDAVELNPAYSSARSNLGLCHYKQKKHESAIEHLKKALELNPDDKSPNRTLRDAYCAIEEFANAFEATRQLNNAEDYQILGTLLLDKKMSESAMEAFQEALGLNPELASAHLGGGIVLEQSDQRGKALESLNEALRLDPTSGEIQKNIAEVFWQQNLYEQATLANLHHVILTPFATFPDSQTLPGLVASGRPSLAQLVHGECGDINCAFRTSDKLEQELIRMFQDKEKDSPEFQGKLSELSDLAFHQLNRMKVLPKVSERQLRRAWENQREKINKQLGTATIRMIFLPTTDETLADQKATAETILSQLRAGETFEELAEKHSPNIGSKLKTRSYLDLNEALRNPAFSLAIGDYTSEVIVASNGLFLLKVESRKPGNATELDSEEVREATKAVCNEQRKADWEKNFMRRMQNPDNDRITTLVDLLFGEQCLQKNNLEGGKKHLRKALISLATNDPLDLILKNRIQENLTGIEAARNAPQTPFSSIWWLVKAVNVKPLPELTQHLKTLKSRPNPEDDHLIDALLQLGLHHLTIEDIPKAYRLADEALAVNNRIRGNGESHLYSALPLLFKAKCQRENGEIEESLASASRGLQLMRKIFPKNHQYVEQGLINYSMSLVTSPSHPDALPILTELIELLEQRDAGSELLASLYEAMGSILLDTGKMREASFYVEKAISRFQSTPKPNPKYYSSALLLRSLIQRGRGQLEEAELSIEHVIQIRRDNPHLRKMLPSALTNYSRILFLRSNYNLAEDAVREALEICSTLSESIQKDAGPAHHVLATLLSEKNQYEEAVKEQRIAIKLAPSGEVRISLVSELSDYLSNLGQLKESASLLREVETWIDSLAAPQGRKTIKNLRKLAIFHFEKENWQTAQKAIKAAIRLEQEKKNPPGVMSNTAILAKILLGKGQYTETEKILKSELLEFQENSNREITPIVITLHSLMSRVYLEQGRYDLAEAELKKSLNMLNEILPPNDPQSIGLSLAAARIYDQQNKHKEVEKTSRSALDLLPADEHETREYAQSLLAISLSKQGHHDEAEEIITRALKSAEGRGEKTEPGMLRLNAIILRNSGKFEKADSIFRAALSETDKKIDENHPKRAPIRVDFAKSLALQNKFDLALPLAEEALLIQEKNLRNDHPGFKKSFDLLSKIHTGLKNPEEALKFTEKSKKLAKALEVENVEE